MAIRRKSLTNCTLNSSIAGHLLSGAHCDHHNLSDTNGQTYAAEKERTYAFWVGGTGGGTVKEDQ